MSLVAQAIIADIKTHFRRVHIEQKNAAHDIFNITLEKALYFELWITPQEMYLRNCSHPLTARNYDLNDPNSIAGIYSYLLEEQTTYRRQNRHRQLKAAAKLRKQHKRLART